VRIKKTYKNVNPELLYDEVKEFVRKQDVIIDEAKLQTYSLPGGSSHVVRGTLVFKAQGEAGGVEMQCLRAHIVGSAISETKVILDINEALFPQEKVTTLHEDLDFIFGSYEIKPR
jgi:hypothetical protein